MLIIRRGKRYDSRLI